MLLSSHILSEVEQLCDRVTIVRAGKAVETGTLADMRHLTRTQLPGATAATLGAARRSCRVCTTRAPRPISSSFDADTDAVNGVLAALTKAGVGSLTVSPPSLEDLFLRHYGDRIESRAGSLTFRILLQQLRRDRLTLPIWIIGTAFLLTVTASSVVTLYGTRRRADPRGRARDPGAARASRHPERRLFRLASCTSSRSRSWR